MIDPLVISLMNKDINLKDYFESEMPIYKIKDESFPSLHPDASKKIIGLEAKYPQEVLTMYESNLKDMFKDRTTNKYSIEYLMVNLPESLT